MQTTCLFSFKIWNKFRPWLEIRTQTNPMIDSNLAIDNYKSYRYFLAGEEDVGKLKQFRAKKEVLKGSITQHAKRQVTKMLCSLIHFYCFMCCCRPIRRYKKHEPNRPTSFLEDDVIGVSYENKETVQSHWHRRSTVGSFFLNQKVRSSPANFHRRLSEL